MKGFGKSNTTLTAATATLIATYNVEQLKALGIHVKNTGGANPLTGFEIRGRSHPDAPFVALASSGFTSIGYWTRWANVDPTTLSAGAAALVHITTEELCEVQVWATSSLGTTVECMAGGFEGTR